MAVSDHIDMLALQRTLLDATVQLVVLARAESWEQLLDAMPAQKAAFAALQASSAMPKAGSIAELRDLIEQTEVANQELVVRLSAWRGEVSTILEEIDMTRANGRKISRAYGA